MSEIPEVDFGQINQEYSQQLQWALRHNQNLVNTAGVTTAHNFERIASEALVKVQSGHVSADQAIREATSQLINQGVIQVQYLSGRRVNIRSALVTNVRTTSKRVSLANSLNLGEQLAATHYEVSAHNDCADDHLWLNGILVRADSPQLREVVEALQRPNCRHSLMLYWAGYSVRNDYGLSDEQTIAKNYQTRQERKRATNERVKNQLQKKFDERLVLEPRFKNKTITRIESMIADQKTETLVLFDHGRPVASFSGNNDQVNISKRAYRELKGRGTTITHNHPDEGGPFSENDLLAAALMDIKELRVVDDTYVYSAKPGEKGWGDPKKLYAKQKSFVKKYLARADAKSTRENPSRKQKLQVWRDAFHEGTQQTAKYFGIIYTRNLRKK